MTPSMLQAMTPRPAKPGVLSLFRSLPPSLSLSGPLLPFACLQAGIHPPSQVIWPIPVAVWPMPPAPFIRLAVSQGSDLRTSGRRGIRRRPRHSSAAWPSDRDRCSHPSKPRGQGAPKANHLRRLAFYKQATKTWPNFATVWHDVYLLLW